MSGPLDKPILSCFASEGQHFNDDLVDVILHCDGSHFTLLQLMDISTEDSSRLRYLPTDGRYTRDGAYVYKAVEGSMSLSGFLLHAQDVGCVVNLLEVNYF